MHTDALTRWFIKKRKSFNVPKELLTHTWQISPTIQCKAWGPREHARSSTDFYCASVCKRNVPCSAKTHFLFTVRELEECLFFYHGDTLLISTQFIQEQSHHQIFSFPLLSLSLQYLVSLVLQRLH